jgi:hypothetical protein
VRIKIACWSSAFESALIKLGGCRSTRRSTAGTLGIGKVRYRRTGCAPDNDDQSSGAIMIDREQNERQKESGQQGTLKPWEKPGQASVDRDYPKTRPDVIEQQKAKKEQQG